MHPSSIYFYRFADRFKGHIKLMIIGLFGIAFVSYLYYISMEEGWIKVPGFERNNSKINFTAW